MTRARWVVAAAVSVAATSACSLIFAVSDEDARGADGSAHAVDPNPRFVVSLLASDQSGLDTVSSNGRRVVWSDRASGFVRASVVLPDGGRAVEDVVHRDYDPRFALVDDQARTFWMEDENCGSGNLVVSVRAIPSAPGHPVSRCGGAVADVAQDAISLVASSVIRDGPAQIVDIVKATLSVRTIDAGADDIGAVATTPDFIYWWSEGTLLQLARQTDAQLEFAANQSGCNDIAADASALYWVVASGSIRRLSHTRPAAKPEDLVTGEQAPTLIALSADYVYWAGSDGRVRGASKLGGAPFTVADQQQVRALTADEAGVYWSDAVAGTVYAGLRQ